MWLTVKKVMAGVLMLAFAFASYAADREEALLNNYFESRIITVPDAELERLRKAYGKLDSAALDELFSSDKVSTDAVFGISLVDFDTGDLKYTRNHYFPERWINESFGEADEKGNFKSVLMPSFGDSSEIGIQGSWQLEKKAGSAENKKDMPWGVKKNHTAFNGFDSLSGNMKMPKIMQMAVESTVHSEGTGAFKVIGVTSKNGIATLTLFSCTRERMIGKPVRDTQNIPLRISAVLYEMPLKEYLALKLKKFVSVEPASLSKNIRKLSEVTLKTMNGRQTANSDTTEKYFPSSWSIEQGGNTVLPEFEDSPYLIGVRFDATACLHMNEGIYTLQFSYAFQQFNDEWDEYPIAELPGKQAVRMPITEVFSASSSTHIAAGAPLLAAVAADNDLNSGRVRLLFITLDQCN